MKCRQNTDMGRHQNALSAHPTLGSKTALDGQKLLKAGMHQDLFQQNQDVLSALM